MPMRFEARVFGWPRIRSLRRRTRIISAWTRVRGIAAIADGVTSGIFSGPLAVYT